MTPGRRLVQAIADKDADALAAALDPEVDFLALTPRRLWEGHTPDEVVDVVLGEWFAQDDHIAGVVAVEEDHVADTARVGYRFDLELPDGPYVAEQQAYYRTDGATITYLRVMCSGFRRRE